MCLWKIRKGNFLSQLKHKKWMDGWMNEWRRARSLRDTGRDAIGHEEGSEKNWFIIYVWKIWVFLSIWFNRILCKYIEANVEWVENVIEFYVNSVGWYWVWDFLAWVGGWKLMESFPRKLCLRYVRIRNIIQWKWLLLCLALTFEGNFLEHPKNVIMSLHYTAANGWEGAKWSIFYATSMNLFRNISFVADIMPKLLCFTLNLNCLNYLKHRICLIIDFINLLRIQLIGLGLACGVYSATLLFFN